MTWLFSSFMTTSPVIRQSVSPRTDSLIPMFQDQISDVSALEKIVHTLLLSISVVALTHRHVGASRHGRSSSRRWKSSLLHRNKDTKIVIGEKESVESFHCFAKAGAFQFCSGLLRLVDFLTERCRMGSSIQASFFLTV